MGHRNMLCTNDMIDIGMDQQGQGYLYHGPLIRVAAQATNFQPPNIRSTVAASGSNPNYDGQYLPERHDGALFYRTVQYNGVHHHHHHNFYPSLVPLSSVGVLPMASDQLSSSGGYGVVGSSGDEFGRSNYYFVDGIRVPGKSKVPESVQGNYHHFNASATPIPSVPPMTTRHPEGVSIPEPVSFPIPQYNAGNGNPSMMHDHNRLPRGNFAGQHYQPSGIWLEQHIGSSSVEGGGAVVWNQGPSIPFMHAPMEPANIGMPRLHETIRNSQNMRYVPSVNQRHQTHHALPPVLRPREHNNFTATSHNRSSSNASRINRNLPHNGLEIGHSHAGAVPPTGIRIYRPHREEGSAGTAPRHHHQQLAQLRYLNSDEVAILEIPDFYEIGDFADHHSDMRLDIEDMSYEELLALGERIGNVNTGLSEKTIAGQLKTVPYLSPGFSLNLEEEAESSDKESHCCIICQDNYKNLEKIGVLDCGHDYHANCLTKWLLIKNVCPICKCEALSTGMDL